MNESVEERRGVMLHSSFGLEHGLASSKMDIDGKIHLIAKCHKSLCNFQSKRILLRRRL